MLSTWTSTGSEAIGEWSEPTAAQGTLAGVKLGLISDVHGNRIALEAVVADGRSMGVERWWALGDLVAIGPSPSATLELLAELPGLAALSGNTERYVLTGDRPPPHPADVLANPSSLELFATIAASFAWTRGYLEAAGWLDWVAALPGEQRLDLPDGTRLLGVHASPGSDDGAGIAPDSSDAELRDRLGMANADLVCAGHTHRPMIRQLGAMTAVNLGAVSNPITGDRRASYALVHADRLGTRVEHRWVSYDIDRFLEQVRASSHPAADYIASFQTGDQVRHPDE